MNVNTLIRSLSHSEKYAAYLALSQWKRELDKAEALEVSLTAREKLIAENNKIEAIRDIRERLGLTLSIARHAVENYLDTKNNLSSN